MFFGSKGNSADTAVRRIVDGGAQVAASSQPAQGIAVQQSDKPADAEQGQRRVAASLRLSVAFRQIVTLLMRSPTHRHLSISDLEWLVLPPLLTGQFRIARVGSRRAGLAVPAAVVLWASVSPEVDAKLSESAKAPIRLRPEEWRSGEIVWLVEAVGDPRVISKILKELNESAFKDREVKVRTREAGSPAIGTLRGVISKSTQN